MKRIETIQKVIKRTILIKKALDILIYLPEVELELTLSDLKSSKRFYEIMIENQKESENSTEGN